MCRNGRYGIVTQTKYYNFVNFGAMLQCYALQQALDKLGVDNTVIDYRTDPLLKTDIDDPLKCMQDSRLLSKLGCRLSYPAIHRANRKFDAFWEKYYRKTDKVYTSADFDKLDFDGYICGSDTVWDIEETQGFDKGFFADYDCMRGKHNITYSPSVGGYSFKENDRTELTRLLKNFGSISLRETIGSGIVQDCTEKDIIQTLDPTLLLDREDYEKIAVEPREKKPYLLVYSRRYDKDLLRFADRVARKHGLKVVEISLRIQNFYKHRMAYDTGVEEFLGLTKNAQCIVTNSFHGAIFAMQFHKDFYVFSRPACSNKIEVVLNTAGIPERLVSGRDVNELPEIDYDKVWARFRAERAKSIKYLKGALGLNENIS